ncbi:MAG: transcriptional repressor [Phycisphaerae bacterium]|nr:transcriptional repressor [Phycisphaerae bacterium]
MDPCNKRERLRQFETLCREHGLALTVQRRQIFELILDRKDHPTADQIYDDVRLHLPSVSRTTVYRVLETLVEIGVITKASSPGAATRFDPVTRRHHHLVCLHCDKVVDLEDEALDAAIELPHNQVQSFDVEDFSVHFHGICAACRRKRSSRGSTSPDRPSRESKRTTRGLAGKSKRAPKRRKTR